MRQNEPLTIELVPKTCWWSNVRSNVSRNEWEKCKEYAKKKTRVGNVVTCAICGGSGLEQGWRYEVEAHEIWHYDEVKRVQTLVDILPLCPLCHQVKHLGRTREVSSPQEWARVIEHLQAVNHWPDWKVEGYIELIFEIWNLRSQLSWTLDVSFLERRIGIDLSGRNLERSGT